MRFTKANLTNQYSINHPQPSLRHQIITFNYVHLITLISHHITPQMPNARRKSQKTQEAQHTKLAVRGKRAKSHSKTNICKFHNHQCSVHEKKFFFLCVMCMLFRWKQCVCWSENLFNCPIQSQINPHQIRLSTWVKCKPRSSYTTYGSN